MKNNNFITIQGWMVNEIGLSGNELLLYALIYGFSQDEQNSFNLSLSYTTKWLNVSKQTVLGLLKKLIEKNLIEKTEKTENGVKFCSYRVVNNFNLGSKEILPPPSKEILLGGSKKTLPPYNIDIYNNLIIKYNNIKEPLDRWLKYKTEKKERYTDIGLEDCFEKLQKLSGGDKELAMAIVKQSTSNNWSGLFPLKNNKQNQQKETTFQRNIRIMREMEEENNANESLF